MDIIGAALFDHTSANVISLDQVLNLIASSFLLGLAIIAIRKSRGKSLLAGVIAFIALFNIGFYYVAVTTDFNEMHRYEYSVISGIRSFANNLTLCGVCVKLFRNHP